MGADLGKLHEELQDGIRELISGEDWQRALEAGARFHQYSFGNVQLIVRQRPDATRVAGFTQWKALGRHVLKGEKGIAILAPLAYRRRLEDADDGTEQYQAGIRGFRIVHVFDVAQTEGRDIPEVAPTLLEGEAPSGLWNDLAEQVTTLGYSLEREAPVIPGANGETSGTARRVRVRPDVDDAQAAKTLAHELAHIRLGHLDDGAPVCAPRSLREVEAESVAFLVCSARGMGTDGYSFAYVAHWANGDPKAIAATGERVMSCARGILGEVA